AAAPRSKSTTPRGQETPNSGGGEHHVRQESTFVQPQDRNLHRIMPPTVIATGDKIDEITSVVQGYYDCDNVFNLYRQ
ncbi:unnamed protein product, partial [Ectocarpus sp. 12 AP-2014]